jgi:hypothetical protein
LARAKLKIQTDREAEMDKEIFDKLNLLILNETLVEELLNIFGPNFSLKQHYNSLTEFKTHLQAICRSYKVQLIFITSNNQENVSGLYQPSPATITISLPKNKEISAQEILNVIFHEYSHNIKENILPDRFNPTRDNLSKIDYKPAPAMRNIRLDDYPEMLKYLEYVLQPAERSSQAFTIAYDLYLQKGFSPVKLYLDNRKLGLVKQLIPEFFAAWANNNQSIFDIEEYIKKTNMSSGVQVLFFIIGYYFEIISHKYGQNNPDLENRISSIGKSLQRLINMIDKYYIRIVGIMNYDKKNRKGTTTFRV